MTTEEYFAKVLALQAEYQAKFDALDAEGDKLDGAYQTDRQALRTELEAQ